MLKLLVSALFISLASAKTGLRSETYEVCHCSDKKGKCKTLDLPYGAYRAHLNHGDTRGRCDWAERVANNFLQATSIIFEEADGDVEQAAQWLEQCWLSGIFAGLIDREAVATMRDYEEFCTPEEDEDIPDDIVLTCGIGCWDYEGVVGRRDRHLLAAAGTVARGSWSSWGSAFRQGLVRMSIIGATLRKQATNVRSVIVAAGSRIVLPYTIGRAVGVGAVWSAARGLDVAFPVPPEDPCRGVAAICERTCFIQEAYDRSVGRLGFVESISKIGTSLEQLCASCDLANTIECDQLPEELRPFPCGIAGGKRCPLIGNFNICFPKGACCFPFEKLCLTTFECTLRVNCCPEDPPCCPKPTCPDGSCEGELCGDSKCPDVYGCCEGRKKCGDFCVPEYTLCPNGSCPGDQCGGDICPLENTCCPGQVACGSDDLIACYNTQCCPEDQCNDGSCPGDICTDSCPKDDGCCEGSKICGETCVFENTLCIDGTCPGDQCGGAICPLENTCCPGQIACGSDDLVACYDAQCCPEDQCNDGSCPGDVCDDSCPKDDGCCVGSKKCGETCVLENMLCPGGSCPGDQCGGAVCPLENTCCPGQVACGSGDLIACYDTQCCPEDQCNNGSCPGDTCCPEDQCFDGSCPGEQCDGGEICPLAENGCCPDDSSCTEECDGAINPSTCSLPDIPPTDRRRVQSKLVCLFFASF